ncbi:MAG TPA: MarR family transcriptional regulator [Stellaceae bacterium]|nr:MarR family transcriptional regulator [Stellaceae bacterium]
MSSVRVNRYVPIVRDFAARVALFHDALAQTMGLNATDVKILRLMGARAMTPGALAAESGLTGAAVTALVDRLEAAGYVTRTRDADDRRKVTVRTVAARLVELDRLYSGLGVEMTRLLGTYDARQFAAILDYLTKGTEILERQTLELRGSGKQPPLRRARPRA